MKYFILNIFIFIFSLLSGQIGLTWSPRFYGENRNNEVIAKNKIRTVKVYQVYKAGEKLTYTYSFNIDGLLIKEFSSLGRDSSKLVKDYYYKDGKYDIYFYTSYPKNINDTIAYTSYAKNGNKEEECIYELGECYRYDTITTNFSEKYKIDSVYTLIYDLDNNYIKKDLLCVNHTNNNITLSNKFSLSHINTTLSIFSALYLSQNTYDLYDADGIILWGNYDNIRVYQEKDKHNIREILIHFNNDQIIESLEYMDFYYNKKGRIEKVVNSNGIQIYLKYKKGLLRELTYSDLSNEMVKKYMYEW
ncbi:MAG: hypothetical protein H6578_00575 [Chitinophagales bacterium]|nr:hypothetical protein [Chitinophagales bacterium]